jgi:hypothetical protein
MHQLDRHGRHGTPRHLTEQREREPREHIGARGAAHLVYGLARAPHVRRFRIVAHQLEREIGLHRRGDVGIAVREQRPSAARALDAAQIVGEPRLHVAVDVVEEMLEQDVLGGNGGVGLEREHEMPVRRLPAKQRSPRLIDYEVGRIRHAGRTL